MNGNKKKIGREGACKAFVFVYCICTICGVVATVASRILNSVVSKVCKLKSSLRLFSLFTFAGKIL